MEKLLAALGGKWKQDGSLQGMSACGDDTFFKASETYKPLRGTAQPKKLQLQLREGIHRRILLYPPQFLLEQTRLPEIQRRPPQEMARLPRLHPLVVHNRRGLPWCGQAPPSQNPTASHGPSCATNSSSSPSNASRSSRSASKAPSSLDLPGSLQRSHSSSVASRTGMVASSTTRARKPGQEGHRRKVSDRRVSN